MFMTYEESQGAAAYSVLEILCWMLAQNNVIDKNQLARELERYALMHEGKSPDGNRVPNDPEVANAIRYIYGIAGGNAHPLGHP
jgi:hypothetical protein